MFFKSRDSGGLEPVILFVLLLLRSLRKFIKSKKGNPTSLEEIELPLLHYSREKSGIYVPLDASSGSIYGNIL